MKIVGEGSNQMSYVIVNERNNLFTETVINEEQMKEIKKMLNEDKSITEIANHLNVTVQAKVKSVEVINTKELNIEEVINLLDKIYENTSWYTLHLLI